MERKTFTNRHQIKRHLLSRKLRDSEPRKQRGRKPSAVKKPSVRGLSEVQKAEAAAKIKTLSDQYAKRAVPAAKAVPNPFPKKPKNYLDYIQSSHWRLFRMNIIIQRGEQCESCQTYGKVQLHHKTYERLFNELPEDVQLLCNDCHQTHHEFSRYASGDVSLQPRTTRPRRSLEDRRAARAKRKAGQNSSKENCTIP